MPIVRELPDGIPLCIGAHASVSEGASAMELVSYVAGEAWSDHPACACPVISEFVRISNDCMPDEHARTSLLTPLIEKIVDTKASAKVEFARAMIFIDWACRHYLPATLEATRELAMYATQLRQINEIGSLTPDFDRAISIVVEATEIANTLWTDSRWRLWWQSDDAKWWRERAAARTDRWVWALGIKLSPVHEAGWRAVWHLSFEACEGAREAGSNAILWSASSNDVDVIERMIAVK